MTYKSTKNLLGILVFLIAITSYLLSLEPTNSFWDCSEFLTCAYGLEIGHAPGAPVFMLLGRLFGLLAKEPSQIAFMINTLSAVSSAITVMILFFTISWFGEKMNVKNNSSSSNFIVLVSAIIGSLTYAFTDSFWFSAVEAEVYATSSLFTALVFWAGLQYSKSDKEVSSNKWIVLIFFILGLSVGIHLLNLLTLPAIALLVYFKHYKPCKNGVLLTLLGSIFLLVLFIYGIIPGVVKLTAFWDRIFVNNFGMPRYTGALFFIAVSSLVLYFSHRYFFRKQKLIQLVIIVSFTFWLIGYSSFTVLVIRSNHNPFVDINNVENIYGLVDYLNREQYPSRPLIYGNSFNSPVVEANKRYTYKYHEGKYYKDELNPSYVYDGNTLSLFPRMASMDKRHIEAYKQWVDIKGRPVNIRSQQGEKQIVKIPTFKENVQFFIRYQFIHMYLRYFMWNFSGKQNDIQGRGDLLHGNWITGITFIDNIRLGDQVNLPDYYKNHKARNAYYLLPFLLGLVGMFYQYRKDRSNFWVNALLFFFTGIAIVLYLNEVPITPRERDYVHVGSFYVFALWIGLGVMALLNLLQSYRSSKLLMGLLGVTLLLAIPLNMFYENWDDHNRSNRYTANAFGKNMLDSCEKNAILCTTADNDTYPLWYLQEVENYRPDIRNVLLTFLPVDWYADQLHHEHDRKGSIPITYRGKELLMKENQYFPVVNKIDSSMDVMELISFVKSTSQKTKIRTQQNENIDFIPGKNLELEVNAEHFISTCSYLKETDISVPKTIKFILNKSYLGRSELLLLDIIMNNDWKRPLYFIYPEVMENLGLGEYLHREGMLYRFMPFTQKEMLVYSKEQSLYQYDLLMNKFSWGNVHNSSVYLDHTNVQNVNSFRIRQVFIESANNLLAANESERAIALLDRIQQLLPPERVPYSWFIPEMVNAYHIAGATEKAEILTKSIEKQMSERYRYFEHLDGGAKQSRVMQETLYIMQQLAELK